MHYVTILSCYITLMLQTVSEFTYELRQLDIVYLKGQINENSHGILKGSLT